MPSETAKVNRSTPWKPASGVYVTVAEQSSIALQSGAPRSPSVPCAGPLAIVNARSSSFASEPWRTTSSGVSAAVVTVWGDAVVPPVAATASGSWAARHSDARIATVKRRPLMPVGQFTVMNIDWLSDPPGPETVRRAS